MTVLDAPVRTRTLTLTILAGEGDGFGLAELEVFSEPEAPPLPFWKLTDLNGNYLYDVLLPSSGEGTFTWTAHDMAPAAVTLECDNGRCAVTAEGESFTVSCPVGIQCTVIARDENDAALDSVRFSNPGPLIRWGMERFDFFSAHRARHVLDYVLELGRKVRAGFMDG